MLLLFINLFFPEDGESDDGFQHFKIDLEKSYEVRGIDRIPDEYKLPGCTFIYKDKLKTSSYTSMKFKCKLINY